MEKIVFNESVTFIISKKKKSRIKFYSKKF